MSGRKESEYALDAEHARRSTLLNRIDAAHREIRGLSTALQGLVREANSIVADLQSSETGAAVGWLEDAARSNAASWSMSQSSGAISRGNDELQSVLRRGRSARSRLTDSVAELKRRRRGLQERLDSLQSELATWGGLVETWIGADHVNSLAGPAEECHVLLRSGRFDEADEKLARSESTAQELIASAQQKECEHIRQEHLQEYRSALNRIVAQVAAVRSIIAGASPGLQATFAAEFEAAGEWLAQNESPPSAVDDGDIDAMSHKTSRLATEYAAGEEKHAALVDAVTHRREQLASRYQAALADVEMRIDGNEALLNDWHGTSETDDLRRSVKSLEELLAAERFLDLDAPLGELVGRLSSLLQDAEVLQERHKKRRHVLESLKVVLAGMDMSFPDPVYERGNDKRSRIRLEVNTHDRGTMTFFLSLEESIEADSCITGVSCFEEFDRLSEELQERFGVNTHFKHPDGSRPQRRVKGEKDEPNGESRSQQNTG